ncbi:MAG TPA: hypothetical protein VKB96_05795, partial [Gammaproteobacteria bacterium]|nr:hypothetical protein [Gammaproteobacteria bacterium]
IIKVCVVQQPIFYRTRLLPIRLSSFALMPNIDPRRRNTAIVYPVRAEALFKRVCYEVPERIFYFFESLMYVVGFHAEILLT